METVLGPAPAVPIVYPESDGKPMAESTLQYQWIVYFRENLADLFADRPDVLVAADNLIYPVAGDNTIARAPDVYVALGRPAGHRGSYRVWDEGGVFPQVIVEVLSPSNTPRDMRAKRLWYRRYGAGEYIQYDPVEDLLEIWVREGRNFAEVEQVHGWTSPQLGVRFDTSGDELVMYRPNGEPFISFHEMRRERDDARRQAAEHRRRAEAEQRRAEVERRRAEEQFRRADKLAAKLRELGVDPDAP